MLQYYRCFWVEITKLQSSEKSIVASLGAGRVDDEQNCFFPLIMVYGVIILGREGLLSKDFLNL